MPSIRRCDFCGTPLTGKRGHGFVESNGTALRCTQNKVLCGQRRRKALKAGIVR